MLASTYAYICFNMKDFEVYIFPTGCCNTGDAPTYSHNVQPVASTNKLSKFVQTGLIEQNWWALKGAGLNIFTCLYIQRNGCV